MEKHSRLHCIFQHLASVSGEVIHVRNAAVDYFNGSVIPTRNSRKMFTDSKENSLEWKYSVKKKKKDWTLQ